MAAAGDGSAPDAVELELYGEVGWSPWGDGVTAGDVSNALRAHPTASEIRLRINSPGGDVWDGMAIYNMLVQHPAKVRVQIDGVAASMASVIAMAGDEIAMAEGAMMMIHDPWTMAAGNAGELRKAADVLDKWGANGAAIYAARSGKTPEKMRQLMLEETWLTAAEAKKLGLVTSVIPNKAKEGAKALADGIVLRGNFRNAPTERLAALGVRVESDDEHLLRVAARADDRPALAEPPEPSPEPSHAAPRDELESYALNPDGSLHSIGLALADMLNRVEEIPFPAEYRAQLRRLLGADLQRVRTELADKTIGPLLKNDSRGTPLGQLSG